MTDLRSLNLAVQVDKGANRSVKAWIAQATSQLEPSPPPPASGPAPPVGPFTQYSTTQTFADVSHPSAIGGIQVTTTDEDGFVLMGAYISGDRPPPSPSAFTVHDILAVCSAPFVGQGNYGFAIRLGTQVNAARLHGEGPNGGLWVGEQSIGSVIEDFVGIGNSGDPGEVGAYLEHLCHDVTLRRGELACGVNGQRSCQVEWTYGGEGSYGITFDAVNFYAPAGGYGLQLGPGTYGCNVLPSCTFTGPGRDILAPLHLADPSKPNTFGPLFTVDIDSDPIG